MSKYTLAVFTNPAKDREDEYNDWYSNQHLKDVVSVAGFLAAQRFRVEIPVVGELKHRYLALYEMEGETDEDVAAAMQALTSTEMYVSDALDAAGSLVGVFEACTTSPSDRAPADFRLLTMAEPVKSREDEYNEWYEQHHMKEVVSVPGFTSGERLKLHTAVAGDFGARYLALFGMDAENVDAAGAALKSLGKANLSISTANQTDKAIAAVYATCSAKVASPRSS